MPTPGVNDYAVDAALTNFAIGYSPQGAIGKLALTNVPVDKEEFTYFKWTMADVFTVPDTLRADETEAKEVRFGTTKVTLSCDEHALKTLVSQRAERNAEAVLRLRMSKTQFISNLLTIALEKQVRDVYNDAAVPKVTLSGTAQWVVSGGGQGSTSVPLIDIDTGIESIRQKTGGFRPNVIVLPEPVARGLSRHTTVQNKIIYVKDNQLADMIELPPVFKGMKVLIPSPIEQTANKGVTPVYADVWGKHCYLAYISDLPMNDVLTFGSLFWNRDEVRVWFDQGRRGNFIEPSKIFKAASVFTDAAYKIENAIV